MTLDRPSSLVNSANTFRSLDKGFRSSYPKGNGSVNNNNTVTDKKMSTAGVLSPLDEAEEWARISDIMASFGAGVARESVFMAELEKEFQQRLGLSLSPSQPTKSLLTDTPQNANLQSREQFDSISSWLRSLNLSQYESVFIDHGFDHLEFLNGIIEYQDLHDLGILDSNHADLIMTSVALLPSSLIRRPSDSLSKWLQEIRLPQYEVTFVKHGFGDMERIRKIWEVELSVVLEVNRTGHRKRMLASLGDRPIEPQLPCSLAPQELSHELSKLNTDISQLKEKLFKELPDSTSRARRPPESNMNTIRKCNAKRRAAPLPPSFCSNGKFGGAKELSLPTDEIALREPALLAVGDGNSVVAAWKHSPTKLVESAIQYVAEYLGSTHVKELKGTESTMKSMHKLRRSVGEIYRLPRITISVSYSGVKFIDTDTKETICEHEIRNIHCTCQESDDLTHFAYITKDIETHGHYCHVFRVPSVELANEIVMTIGQAFEVAFQLAIRSKNANKMQSEAKNCGHSRSISQQVTSQPIQSCAHNRSLSSSSSSRHGSDCVAPPNNSMENLLDSGNFSDREHMTMQSTNLESSNTAQSATNGGSATKVSSS